MGPIVFKQAAKAGINYSLTHIVRGTDRSSVGNKIDHGFIFLGLIWEKLCYFNICEQHFKTNSVLGKLPMGLLGCQRKDMTIGIYQRRKRS